jgi:hypothetical protein
MDAKGICGLGRARDLAYELLEEHGLLARGWHAQLEPSVSTLGRCDYAHKTIFLSMHHVESSSEEDVRQTLLGEIARAVAGPSHVPRGQSQS